MGITGLMAGRHKLKLKPRSWLYGMVRKTVLGYWGSIPQPRTIFVNTLQYIKIVKNMKQQEALDKFKEFCRKRQSIDERSELDWYALSLGYFAALGFSDDECHDLAIKSRYTYEYWC